MLLLLGASGVPAVRSAEDVRDLLRVGMRVEIEGRLRGDGSFQADVVKLKGDRKESLRIEGLLSSIDPNAGHLEVAGFRLAFDAAAGIPDGSGGSLDPDGLVPEGRIRMHVSRAEGRLRVKSIRRLDSRDRDTEVTAPVEAIRVRGRRRMEVVVLGRRFRCDETTEFRDPEGNRITLDFTRVDTFHRLVDDDDRRPEEQFRLGDLVTVGGEVQVDMIPEENLDLFDPLEDSDVLFSRVSTRLELASTPHPDIDVFVKVAASEPVGPFDTFHPVRSEGQVRLAEANILLRRFFTRRLALEVGRQDFDEKREWLYDENLDGVRLYLDLDPVRAELSVSTNFSETTEADEGVVNYILYTSYEMPHRRELAFYIIDREDNRHPDVDYNRRWYGLRSFGRLGKMDEYWVELSWMRGEKQGRALEGSAWEVGFTHVLRGVLFEPSFTFGYAWASGDRDFRDNVDGNFRQPGFEDNNDKFNGVNSFRYYGELFDPELSNMRIFTSDVGFRWSRRGSIDIAYHTYRQVVRRSNIHGGNLLIEPWGRQTDIGDEIDFIAGYEKLWNIDLELIVGVFRPGTAFAPFNDTAVRSKLEIEFNF
jgi:hypothetical protein